MSGIQLVAAVSLACSLFTLVSAENELAGQSRTFEVAAGARSRREALVVADVPKSLRATRLKLVRVDNGQEIDLQKVDANGKRIAWIVRGLAAGEKRRYSLQPGKPRTTYSVRSELRRGVLDIRLDGKSLLQYKVAVAESPSGIDPVYRRSGYIHPIRTPAGIAVTDDFPPDHAHQHALFFAWVNASFRGRRVDFWNQKGRTGRIEHGRLDSVAAGPLWGEFVATIRHLALDAKDREKVEPVLLEQWRVRAFVLNGVTVVDLRSEQACQGEPLTINRFHYGGLALRGNRAWFATKPKAKPPGRFLTSDGKSRRDGNHSRPRWVCLSGPTKKGPAGLVAMSHPDNFRHPQHVRLHPTKPYFCFSPMVEKGFQITRAKKYVSRYRLLAFDGEVNKDLIESMWFDYATPPSVK